MDEVNITIIGAGVVGLAIAAELSQQHDNIVVLEKNDSFGRETSSRNSEVIHSGIYYPAGSLKAKLCIDGARLLYEYCAKQSIPYSKLGKLIVATNATEEGYLQELYKNGVHNGVKGLILLSKEDAGKMEPRVNVTAAIFSPETGIVDSHSLMSILYNVANASGALFSFNSEVCSIERCNSGYVIGVKEENYKFFSRIVINSAGLNSDYVAALAGINVDDEGYRLRYCKGSYFAYSKKSPVRMLIYSVPHEDLKGLGVHATLDMSGRLRFGPDAEYIDYIDFKVDKNKRDMFYEGARKIINGLERDAFIPDMAGIRPKIKGEGIKDFVIRHENEKGLTGLINLIGIESPGLTAALAIAEYVKDIVNHLL